MHWCYLNLRVCFSFCILYLKHLGLLNVTVTFGWEWHILGIFSVLFGLVALDTLINTQPPFCALHHNHCVPSSTQRLTVTIYLSSISCGRMPVLDSITAVRFTESIREKSQEYNQPRQHTNLSRSHSKNLIAHWLLMSADQYGSSCSHSCPPRQALLQQPAANLATQGQCCYTSTICNRAFIHSLTTGKVPTIFISVFIVPRIKKYNL